MATDPIGGASGAGGASGTNSAKNPNDALRGLDMDEFLKLMIAELQNQDPLSPMENSQILQQISQIREIGATSQLSDTLDSVLLGQNLSSASSMIGKLVEGLTDKGDSVTGVVERVSVAGGVTKLHIGQETIGLKNIREIKPPATTAA